MCIAEADIAVSAPSSQVWPIVSDLSNYARFLSHLREVRSLSNGMSEWRLSGLLGIPIIWQTKVKLEVPHRVEWNPAGGVIGSQGFVHLEPQRDDTRIVFRLEYYPPAGALEAMFAQLFTDPQKMLEDDLKKLDQFVMQQVAHD